MKSHPEYVILLKNINSNPCCVEDKPMRLSVLLKELQYTCLRGSEDIDVAGVAYDSRRVETGSLFICKRQVKKKKWRMERL